MARMDKQTATKAAIAIEFTKQRQLLEERIKELELALAEKNNIINEMKRESVLYTTEEHIIKRVLELKAQGHQYSVILDKLKFSSLNTTIEEIRNICLNTDSLSPELQLYYKTQVQAFEDSIKVNPELLKDTLTKRYEFLYNEASIDLINAVEVEERRRIRVEMKDHLKALNEVLKNIVYDEESDIVKDEIHKSMNDINKLQENMTFQVQEEYIC
jgi:hypothetical protein